MANRNMCFSDFAKLKTAKGRWHSLVSRMGDGDEYLETLLLYRRSLARWVGLMVYQFFLHMVLRWRASRAEAPL